MMGSSQQLQSINLSTEGNRPRVALGSYHDDRRQEAHESLFFDSVDSSVLKGFQLSIGPIETLPWHEAMHVEEQASVKAREIALRMMCYIPELCNCVESLPAKPINNCNGDDRDNALK